MSFDVALVFDSIPQLLEGLWLTLQLYLLALGLGTMLAIALVLLRISQKSYLRSPAATYIYFFRGTPLLVQLFVVYYGFPQIDLIRDSFLWPVFREPFYCVLFTLCLNVAAYTAEIFRGGILGVDKGLSEAARALGLSQSQTFRKVVFPIAFKLSLPAYGNEMISVLKATALASTVTLLDMTGVARTLVAETYAPYEIFLAAAAVYLVLAWFIQRFVKAVESRISRY